MPEEVNEENSNHEEEIEQNQTESTEENTEPQEEEIKISLDDLDEDSVSSLSAEELDKLIDNSDNLTIKKEVEKSDDNDSSNNESKKSDQSDKSEVNGDSTPDDLKFLESLPEEYRKVFGKIKANGIEREFKPDEIIRMVQLGSKYYADRETIKPQLKIVNMLEKAQITNEEQLTQALDLISGDKNALAKFIKDKEIDLLDLEELIDGGENNYQPNPAKYEVSDSELRLKEVDAELRSSENYDTIYDTINSIDDYSRQAFIEDPDKILALDAHMKNGFYEQVQNEISRGKMFGEYINQSFIEAYETAGQRIISSMNQEPQQQQVVQNQTKKVADNTVPNSLKKADKGRVPIPPKTIDLNDEAYINSLSPEELEKLLK